MHAAVCTGLDLAGEALGLDGSAPACSLGAEDAQVEGMELPQCNAV